jgi:fatty acid amide hydrolase 2
MRTLLASPAVDLASLVRAREVSPVELCEHFIRRIEEVNPSINAVVARRFDEARREARAAEEAVTRAADPRELPPLHGVPCTVKEFYGVTGMPQTGGLVRRRGTVADEDAVVVQRLRAAGAVILGVTNVPEGGLWMETHNRVYGRTNNPWDVKRTSGGSSGGEAAIVAAGGAPFGMGSDIGGSIRTPAAFCGVAGHKPTGRLVPNTGHFPDVVGELRGMLVCGPIARSARDLMPVLRVVAGPCERTRDFVQPFELGDPAAIDLRDVVVFPMEHGAARVSPPMAAAVRRSAAALEARGARVESWEAPRMRKAFWIWSAMLSDEPDNGTYAELLSGSPDLPYARELLRLALGRSAHTLPALTVAAAESIFRKLPARPRRFVEMGRALRHELEDRLGDRGVILHPPYTRVAPRHDAPLLTPFDFVCTGLFNVLEMPATTVPTGLSEEGLPVGVQVIARRGLDHLTIAVATALEDAFGRLGPVDPRAPRGAAAAVASA